ncbi:hypothetical protein HDC94_000179 [Leifsonia sp. AK011]|uniref:FtsX-like permease family protein n=1 Tax=Leifsonia sp. AK011 TaxID=2723075 RepID=UPI0015CD178E|nr:FtsX-like permease family protein [Leifsonia sp. AK011]NYF09023.1 hypothetical protein [Leifsonia sp. AK011]
MSLSRLRGSAPTLAAILVVVVLLCGFSIATTVYLDQQATKGLRSELASRAGADLALRAILDLAPADDEEGPDAPTAGEQDAAVRAAVERTFDGTGVTFDVTRSLEANGRYETTTGEADATRSGSATIATISDLDSRADFSAGRPAEGPNEVAVQQSAAADIGLRVGDEVLLGDIPFRVSGTWVARDGLDPRWYGDETVVTGGTAPTAGIPSLGPFVITEEAWSRIDSAPAAIWTMVPRSFDEFTTTNRAEVTAAWAGVPQEWRGEVPESDSLVAQGRLARTLDDFGGRIAGLRAIEPVAAVLVAGSAVVVLSQLVQLLVASREDETRLFWSRGQSPLALARRTTVEVAVVTLIGASLGIAAVTLWLALTSSLSQLLAVRTTAIIVPAVVVLAAIVFAAVTSYRSVLSVTTATRGGRGERRVRRVAVPGLVILITLAAAVSVWQLRLYGSPLTANAEGSTSIDPIAVAAPALALVAVVLASLAAFPAVVSLYARGTRDAGVPAHLSARTLAQRTGRVTAPLVIVALAVGSATIGATFSSTWTNLFDTTAALHAGSELRVSSPFDPLTADEMDAVASADGIALLAPLDEQVLSIGTIGGTVLSATPDAVRRLASSAGGAVNTEELASAIAAEQPGPSVPEGATALTLRAAESGFVEPPRLSAWIADSLGRLREVSFAAPIAEADGVFSYTADLTAVPRSTPGTLVSFDLELTDQPVDATAPAFRLVGLDAEVGGSAQSLELDQFWMADSLRGQFEPPRVSGAGDGFVLTSALPFVRMTATLDGTAVDTIQPGVVVTEHIAELLELEVGDLVVYSLRDVVEPVNSVVTAIVPAIPGTNSESSVLMDLTVINHFHQRANSEAFALSGAWVKGDGAAPSVDTLRPLLPTGVRIISSDDPVGRQVLGAASVALWVAALCCLLIALVAVGSASSSRIRWGRSDIASLRAIGLTAREQATTIVRELGLVVAVAAITGLLAGVLVSVLTVPELARAAVDRAFLALGTDLSVDWLGLGLMLGGLAIGVTLIVAALARRVRALAASSLPSEGRE